MIGIVGYGMVGRAQHRLFPDAVVCDEPLGLGSREEINQCEVVFVCVPTPMAPDGSCDLSTIEDVISWVRCSLIIIRSTIPPGTTDRLKREYGKAIVFQPEHLGETPDHPLADMRQRPFLILGGERTDTNRAIQIYQQVYNASVTMRQMSSIEAEMAKYLANRHIAFKVAECNEAYDLCQALGIDWNIVREAVYQDDPRMSPYWTFVYPENRGFGGKCIPKDLNALCHLARQMGIPLEISEKILKVNETWRVFSPDAELVVSG